MSKKKTNNSEYESEKTKKVREIRKTILECSNKIMEENKLNPDQQMALMLFVTIEKCMNFMELTTFTSGCMAVSILLEELIHSGLDLENESIQV